MHLFPCSEKVVVLAAGISNIDYTDIMYKPTWIALRDATVWGVNHVAAIFRVDACFHMHDIRKEDQARLQRIDVPIMSIDSFDGQCVKYPLEEIVEEYGSSYFRNSAAYVFAYAAWRKVKELWVFGYDFNYPDRSDYEVGRCSAEFWLGVCHAQGMEVNIGQHSTLCDTTQRLRENEPLYGYGAHQPDFDLVDGKLKVVRNGLRELQEPVAYEG